MPPDNFSKEAKKHISEAWRNHCIYIRLLDVEPSWALVLMFYSSLHLVQAHAVDLCSKKQGIHLPHKHPERTVYISQNLQRIMTPYRELQTASEDVRSDLIRYTYEDVLNFYSSQFSPIWEDLHKKRVSWEIRLTENERDAISASISNEEEHNTT